MFSRCPFRPFFQSLREGLLAQRLLDFAEVTKVVELISGLKLKIQQDGKAEQALYDKSSRFIS